MRRRIESLAVTDPFSSDPILVEVVRNGLTESVHRARVAITGPDGELIGRIGAVDAQIYPRSALKPLQAVAMVDARLDLPDDLLALVAASHSGEEIHLDGSRRILAGAGLTEAALQTPPDWPVDDEARVAYIRTVGHKTSIAMNCSGKHAGMLATAVRNGWSLDDYRDPAHPVQLAARDTIGELSGERPTTVAVDGCGAPAFALSLTALARSFGRLAVAAGGSGQRVADAIRAHPEMTSGTRRDEYDLHRAIPGLLTKAGAEAVQAVGLPDGRGIAIKIADGTPRARPVLVAAVLLALGYEHPTLAAQASAPVLGHGERVGAISVRRAGRSRRVTGSTPARNRSPLGSPLVDWDDYDAVLFDLDGVLTPTAEVHMHAWAELFTAFLSEHGLAEHGIAEPYSESDYFDYIDGKPRYDGVRSMLASRGITLPEGDPSDPPTTETVCGLGNRKNEVFAAILHRDGVEPYPGSVALLDHLAGLGTQVAVVSSSRNAPAVLAAAGLADRFEVVVDGAVATAHRLPGKPAPRTPSSTRPTSWVSRSRVRWWSRTRCPGSRPARPATSGW